MGTPFLVAGAGLIVLATLVWLTIHAVGLVLWVRAKGNTQDPHRLAIAGWIVAFGSGFTGPCVLLGQVAALVLAGMALAKLRAGEAGPGTRVPAVTTIVSAVVLLLGMGIALPVLLSQPF